ncbi:hypothetical protein Taro_000454 [Colocasia esculenta]|uniref:Uncharacterized protein n=1 Tax=Colocasia esculenta TaxID=4460 RepID=A0A843TF07_COLES|nr:hypothetical protein [Colocasia esculenta]
MKVRVRGNNIAITQNTTTRQQDFYPGSELLSTGDLRPVPEQYLRISLIKGTVPLKDTTTPSSAANRYERLSSRYEFQRNRYEN